MNRAVAQEPARIHWRWPLSAFDRWLMAPAPAVRLAVLRVIVGGFALVYLLARLAHLWRLAQVDAIHFAPVGVTRMLAAPLPAWAVAALMLAALLAAAGFLLGFHYRISGPAFAALFLSLLTYENSFGTVLHVANLLVLYVGVLGLTPAADALSLDRRRRTPAVAEAASCRYGWPIRLMALLCVASYLVAGIAKLKHSGLGYASDHVLSIHVAFDNMRKIELGSFYSPLGVWLVPFDGVWTALGTLTLLLELGAPVALCGGRIARSWILMMWSFHFGVLLTMMIFFPFPLLGGAFAPFFRLEKLLERWPKAARWA